MDSIKYIELNGEQRKINDPDTTILKQPFYLPGGGTYVKAGDDSTQGAGYFFAIRHGNILQLDFSFKITEIGTKETENWGISPAVIVDTYSLFPQNIEPLAGGNIMIYSPGTSAPILNGYAATMQPSSDAVKRWTPSYVSSLFQNPSTGAVYPLYTRYKSNAFAEGTYFNGTCYGKILD